MGQIIALHRKRAVRSFGILSYLSSLLIRIFGCSHRDMSRPFSPRAGLSYRSCLTCGARRNFDTKAYEMVGPYFFPSPEKE